MAVEAKRGCGFRKVEGLYLVCDPGVFPCDRFPIELTVCPHCGEGIKHSRAWKTINPITLFGDHMVKGWLGQKRCPEHRCPVCRPKLMGEKAGLMWVGERHYPTPGAFTDEARVLGISKRIKTVPKDLELGKTWVLLAHIHADTRMVRTKEGKDEEEKVPGIFHAFLPQRVERIFNESQKGSEAVGADVNRGITPVFVPDDDPDHHNG